MRVLVADDDTFFLKVVNEVLTGAGFEVHTARNGEAALYMIREIAPDVAILDVVMPDLSGIEVSQKIRNELKIRALPILLVSAGVEELQAAGGDPTKYQADDFLHKPFNPEVLIARVQRLARLGVSRLELHHRPTLEIMRAQHERRNHPRVPADIDVTARFGEKILYNPLLNIGNGGVCIAPASEIELRFALPGPEAGMVAAVGWVIWCQDLENDGRWNAGVAFTDLLPEDAERVGFYTRWMQHVVTQEFEIIQRL